MLNNKTVLQTASKIFEKYDLPNGGSITGRDGGEVVLGYVYSWSERGAFLDVVRTLNARYEEVAGEFYILEYQTREFGTPVRIRAQVSL